MIVSEDGRVSGSVDRAKLAELYMSAKDEELKAHYLEVDPGLADYLDEQTQPEPVPEPEPAPAAKKAAAKKTAEKEVTGGH